MKARFLILCLLFGALAVYWATRASAPPAVSQTNAGQSADRDAVKRDDAALSLAMRPLKGHEPLVPPEFDIYVEVDPTGEKNRLFFYITEAHGYYVESLNVLFYYKPTPDTTPDDSPLAVSVYLDDYITAGETYKGCTDVTDHELSRIGGVMGRSENWGATVVDYGRARETNPDPLPEVSPVGKCRPIP